ncbi:hypothetical protein MMC25_004450 [Agyrium rufum]|nr:hypothetical protein [Agyrium rufum]
MGLHNESLLHLVAGQPNEDTIRDLRVTKESEPSAFLRELTEKFVRMCGRQRPGFEIVAYYEQRESATLEKSSDGTLTKAGPPSVMVTQESACRIGLEYNFYQQLPLNKDHSGLVKFSSCWDETYTRVRTRLGELVKSAPRMVEKRFAMDEDLSNEEKILWTDLNQPPYSAFRNSQNLSKPTDKTLQWLIQDEKVDLNRSSEAWLNSSSDTPLEGNTFVSWRDSPESGSLLVTGAPGQGKSVLSNYVLGHLEQAMKDLQSCKIIYYFCTIRNSEELQTPHTVLRALLVQLCEDAHLFRLLPLSIQKSNPTFQSLSFDSLWDLFRTLIQKSNYIHTYCVLDGLDVYGDCMNDLITALAHLFTQTYDRPKTRLKLFCTSRPSLPISDAWQSQPTRILRANHEDLDIFVKTQVDRLPPRFSSQTKDQLSAELMKNTGQTFLWVDIVMRRIRPLGYPSPDSVSQEIKNSSRNLHLLYQDLISKALERDRANAYILIWVMHAKRPLTLRELGDAVALSLKQDCHSYQECSLGRPNLLVEEFRKSCGTLLDVVDDEVFPIHQSLKDYVTEEKCLELDSSFEGVSPKLFHTKCCITYLAFQEFSSDCKLYAWEVPFLDYAANYWDNDLSVGQLLTIINFGLERILSTDWRNVENWVGQRAFRNGTNVPRHITRVRQMTPGGIAVTYDMGWLAELLLNNAIPGLNNDFEEKCLEYAAMTEGKVLRVLLNRRGAIVRDFEDIMVAAADNVEYGEDLITYLLKHRGGEIHITNRILVVAARNYGSAVELLTLLLDHGDAEIGVSEELMIAVAGNVEGMRLLFDRRGAEICVSEKVIIAVARNVEGMRLLLDRRGREISITNEILETVALRGFTETMELILDRRGTEINISDKVVEAAAGNFYEEQMLELLLDRRGAEVHITEEVLKCAVYNAWKGEEVTKLLLDRRGSEVHITREVLRWAVANEGPGKRVTELLLDRRSAEVHITEEILKCAVANHRGWLVVELLMDRRGAEVHITEEVLKRAVANGSSGKKVTELLLDRRGAEVHITEEVLKRAVANKVSGKEVTELLLDRRGAEVHITEEVLKCAITNRWSSKRVTELLLDRRGAEVHFSEGILKHAAANRHVREELMELLLAQEGAEAYITEEVLEAAAGNRGYSKLETVNIMKMLLEKRGPDVHITEEILQAASRQEMRQLLSEVMQREAT